MMKTTFLILFFLSSYIHAANPVLTEHEKGWYWHDDPKVVKKKSESEKSPASIANPEKTWKLIGKMVDEARARAILNPDFENIAIARKLQKRMVTQANLFSERWMLDLLLHPENDESLQNPHNSNARDIYHQQKNLLKEAAIARLSEVSGFYYFYDGAEVFSEAMAKIVRDFAERYQIRVIPLSMNGKISIIFPQSQSDAGQAKALGVKHIPALFTIHPESKNPVPLAYGLLSQSELKENILAVMQAFQSGEKP